MDASYWQYQIITTQAFSIKITLALEEGSMRYLNKVLPPALHRRQPSYNEHQSPS